MKAMWKPWVVPCLMLLAGCPSKEVPPKDPPSFGAPVRLQEGSLLPVSSWPLSFVSSVAAPDTGLLFFSPQIGRAPTTWWRTDGTPQGTFSLQVDASGVPGAPSPIALGSRVYLASLEQGLFPGHVPWGLWSSDGSIAGSVPVAVGLAGTPEWYTATPGGVLFVTRRGESAALWRTDGTEAGTTLVSQLPDTTSVSQRVGQSGTTVWFILGRMLWKTDGTAEGTALVRDFTAEGGIGTGRVLPSNGRLVFKVADSQLWSTDGTSEGTAPLKGSFNVTGNFFLAGDSLVFFGCTLETGCEPWRTDGTAPGTWLLKDTAPSNMGVTGKMLGEARGLAYFDAYDGSSKTVVWRTDGTPEGTFPLPAGYSGELYPVGNQVFLLGSSLWRTDGTPGGTREVDTDGPFTVAGQLGDRLVYVKTAASALHQVRTLRPEGGPEVVTDIPASQVVGLVPSGYLVLAEKAADSLYSVRLDTGEHQPLPVPLRGGGTQPSNLVPGEGRLLFHSPGSTAVQVWEAQGTPESIRLLVEGKYIRCADCLQPPQPRALGRANGVTFYTTGEWLHALPRDAQAPVELMRGVVLQAAEQEGQLLFILGALDSTQEAGLWRSDGTVEGTVRLARLSTGSFTYLRPTVFARAGQRHYFTLDNWGSNTSQLWVTDGTEEGTRALRTFARTRLATGGGLPEGSLVFGCSNTVVHPSEQRERPWALCVSDGTEAGTLPLAGLREGSNPEGFTAFQGAVYFSADDGEHGRELWRSQGTPASTRLVKDFIPGANNGQPEAFLASTAGLFFRASTREAGAELWRMNASGQLQQVTDSIPGPHSGRPEELLALEPEGVVLFTARSVEHGTELWLSDGTPQGTRLLVDLVPGFRSGRPGNLVRMGNSVYFAGEHPEHGRVLWLMPFEP